MKFTRVLLVLTAVVLAAVLASFTSSPLGAQGNSQKAPDLVNVVNTPTVNVGNAPLRGQHNVASWVGYQISFCEAAMEETT